MRTHIHINNKSLKLSCQLNIHLNHDSNLKNKATNKYIKKSNFIPF